MNKRQRENGQSMVEFALIIVVVIFMITVFIDVSRGLYYYSALNNSVREGARYAIVHPMASGQDIENIKNVVKDYAVGLDRSNIVVVVTICGPCGGDKVTVAASYLFAPVTPGLQFLLGPGGMNLHTQSTMLTAQ